MNTTYVTLRCFPVAIAATAQETATPQRLSHQLVGRDEIFETGADDPLQDVGNAASRHRQSYPGVTLADWHRVENPNYLFLHLNIGAHGKTRGR